MWVKMAKENKPPKQEKKVEIPKAEKHSYFPRFLIVFSILIMVLALNHFFKWYVLPNYIVSIALFISGLWMLSLGLGKGIYKKRKEIVKKFI